ncbi:hypothetical protein EJ04DRAFT_561710 [Polyplosphaeria fusca]|uniref:Uncharacterized protein n=1 Tax=Polyplosphaeria fusca TaxID=682080 RepID=A0A9P4V5C8_9PLEO|nr:hypothetical protein EJ04DRAFT_561710 [Polyplosphaeria fusca]
MAQKREEEPKEEQEEQEEEQEEEILDVACMCIPLSDLSALQWDRHICEDPQPAWARATVFALSGSLAAQKAQGVDVLQNGLVS